MSYKHKTNIMWVCLYTHEKISDKQGVEQSDAWTFG